MLAYELNIENRRFVSKKKPFLSSLSHNQFIGYYKSFLNSTFANSVNFLKTWLQRED